MPSSGINIHGPPVHSVGAWLLEGDMLGIFEGSEPTEGLSDGSELGECEGSWEGECEGLLEVDGKMLGTELGADDNEGF